MGIQELKKEVPTSTKNDMENYKRKLRKWRALGSGVFHPMGTIPNEKLWIFIHLVNDPFLYIEYRSRKRL
jgi:hypothetical protein